MSSRSRSLYRYQEPESAAEMKGASLSHGPFLMPSSKTNLTKGSLGLGLLIDRMSDQSFWGAPVSANLAELPLIQHPQCKHFLGNPEHLSWLAVFFFFSWALNCLECVPISLTSLLWHQKMSISSPLREFCTHVSPLSSLLSSWKWLSPTQFLLFHHFQTLFHTGLVSLCPYHLLAPTPGEISMTHLEPKLDVSMYNGSSVLSIKTSPRSWE